MRGRGEIKHEIKKTKCLMFGTIKGRVKLLLREGSCLPV